MQILKTSLILSLLTVTLSANPHPVAAEGLAYKILEALIGPPSQSVDVEYYRPDPMTRQCLGCHDGGRAVRIDAKPAGSPMEWEGGHSVNHPIGMNYADSYDRNPREYIHPGRLNPAVRLPSGQVTCISCHELRQKPDVRPASFPQEEECLSSRAFVVTMSRDRLCLACHIK